MTSPGSAHYDVVVVGSGFGGSVSALRLAEKGYSVAVLEAGARFADSDFAATSFDLKRYLFAPALGMYGIQRIELFSDCLVMAGAGVGGGSLVYANTLYEPLEAFYDDPAWAHITDWRTELAPFYDQAKRMLGVVTNPRHTPSDEVMKQVADEMGVGESFHPTPVGVFFGVGDGAGGEQHPDPFFGGAGPSRTSCTHCGECMTGCRHGAKNTLVKNYLHLAERLGVEVHPLTTVTRVLPRAGGGYEVRAVWSKAKLSRRRAVKSFTCDQVVFAAASLGTQKLLHKLKATGDLTGISDRLGTLTRTNSEAILGAVAGDLSVDHTEGVAITSSFHPDEHTHVEPVRFGRGSNAIALLQTVLTPEVPGERRLATWFKEVRRSPREAFALYDLKHWSERAVIALVMQSRDNSLTTRPRRTPWGWTMATEQGHGEPNPTYIPVAHEVARRMARILRGQAGGTVGEPLERPMTAHFIGGCTIGLDASEGVVDPWHRLHGHPGLHVVDGSTISANLGVNPSLTIAAQAERAMAFWPNKGEVDPRPEPGSGYRPVKAVEPRWPAVPVTAPAALRLPLLPNG